MEKEYGREEMVLGFYQMLRKAMKKGYRVSINAIGFKNLNGKVKRITKYAILLDRGGFDTLIRMDAVRMVTVYPPDEEVDDNE